MPFVVPKFIERQPKIVGPLTFQQFIFIGGAAAICFVFYFTLPIYIFFIASLVLITGAIFFTFGKIREQSIPVLIKNFSSFLLSPRIYLWKKGGAPPKIVKIKKTVRLEKKKQPSVLYIAEKSRIKNLSAKIETGQR